MHCVLAITVISWWSLSVCVYFYGRLKCTVVVRLFSFLSVLLNLHHSVLDQVVTV